jgi:hypothetical protein
VQPLTEGRPPQHTPQAVGNVDGAAQAHQLQLGLCPPVPPNLPNFIRWSLRHAPQFGRLIDRMGCFLFGG